MSGLLQKIKDIMLAANEIKPMGIAALALMALLMALSIILLKV